MPSRNTIEIVISAKDEASQVLESSDSLLGKLGKTAAIGATAIVGATVAIGGGMLALAKDAAPIEGVKKAFEGLAEASGKSSKDLLAALADSSKGMITNADLMKSYNSAAQLVSQDFANQLPDAMQYLTKVAAATGQDMGFMMDSLVKGVGRASPMILDNLGIQVNLTEATEEYAKSVGKSASELTKGEVQTAIMNKTLEQLKKNTAAMPDVTDNAQVKWAAFQTRLANFKDDVGLKLLPFFEVFISLLMKVADVVLPLIMPLLESLSNSFMSFFESLSSGEGIFGTITTIVERFAIMLGNGGLAYALANLFVVYEDGSSVIGSFLEKLGLAPEIANTVAAAFDGVYRTVSGFLSGVVNFITGTVIPALQAFANWFIQDALPVIVGFIQGTVIPAIQRFIGVLVGIWNMVSPVLSTMLDWFINTGLPLIVGFIRDTVIPYIQKLTDGIFTIWEKVQPGLQKLFDWFVTTGFPLITAFIENIAMPIIQKIIDLIGNIWSVVAPALGDLAAWFLEDALPSVLSFITDTALPVIQSIIDILKAIWTAVKPSLDSFINGVKSTMDQVRGFIQPVVDFVNDLIRKFNDLKNMISGGVGALGGAAQNASTAAGLVASGQVSPGDFLSALGNAISSEFSGYALGIPTVPEDGLYKLHAGERVVPTAENQYGSGGNQIAINFYGGEGIKNQADANDAGFMITSALRQNGVNF